MEPAIATLIIEVHEEVYGHAPVLFGKIVEYAKTVGIPEVNRQEARDLLSVYGQAELLVQRRPELEPFLRWLDRETGCDE